MKLIEVAEHKRNETVENDDAVSRSGTTSTTSPKSRRTCTYVLSGEDFLMQHWYNCYTCGLLFDKGCCSLCAQVCHKGHDVGYSRKSSFFCDCGAEGSAQNSRLSCKCQVPLLAESPSFQEEDGTRKFTAPPSVERTQIETFRDRALKLMIRNYPSCAMESIDTFVQNMVNDEVLGKTSKLFNDQFMLWTQRENMKDILSRLDEDKAEERETLRSRDLSLHLRNGLPLTLGKLTDSILLPIRAAKTNCIHSRLSGEFSVDRMKRNFLSKNGIDRQIIEADSRGRIIIAETHSNDTNSSELSSLLFCSALPLVNTRFVPKPVDSHIQKSQLLITGSKDVDFSVVGMSLCKDKDNHLIVWGTSKVSVFVLNQCCDSAMARIDLVIDLDPVECETDYILKGEWMLASSGVSDWT